MPTTKDFSIFLSYSRKDAKLMKRMRDDLYAKQLNVWVDETGLEPGTPDWKVAIEQAIEGADCMVVILSPDAKKSRWVGIEVSYAQIVGIPIFPMIARGDNRNAIPIDLMNVQRIDARDDYAGAIIRLVETIYRRIEGA